MKKRTRQRLFKFVLLFVAIFLLAACNSSATEQEAPAEESVAEEAAADEADQETAEEPADEAEADEETEASGEPIRIGGSLALTGFLAPTAAIHKIVGDEFIEKINSEGGLLGRPVEWVLFDDESSPDRAAALYERLITEEEVDLLIGS